MNKMKQAKALDNAISRAKQLSTENDQCRAERDWYQRALEAIVGVTACGEWVGEGWEEFSSTAETRWQNQPPSRNQEFVKRRCRWCKSGGPMYETIEHDAACPVRIASLALQKLSYVVTDDDPA